MPYCRLLSTCEIGHVFCLLLDLATPVAKQRLQRFQADLNSLRQRIDIAAQVSKILGRKFPTFPALKPIEEELALLSIVLNLLSDVQTSIDRYKQRTWKELRFEAVSQDMLAYASACK